MIRLAASICLVPEISGGPFLYSGDLAESCRQATEAGFDAVELLVPDGNSIDTASLRKLLAEYHLGLSGLGTGAGFLVHQFHLSSPDPEKRRRAREYAAAIVDRAGEFGAFAILGSLKGSVEPGVSRQSATQWLGEGLGFLAARADRHGAALVLEPLNRYESNYLNRLEEGVELIRSLPVGNVRLLADLFHMNIEEACIAEALRSTGKHVGHVHFVDSNRRPAGCGHINLAEVGRALREIGYQGFLAAEALPWPDSQQAALQTVAAFRQHITQQEPAA
jgi:sugar phosphate isomerase/epimerase